MDLPLGRTIEKRKQFVEIYSVSLNIEDYELIKELGLNSYDIPSLVRSIIRNAIRDKDLLNQFKKIKNK